MSSIRGWDSTTPKYRDIEVDTAGRLYVTPIAGTATLGAVRLVRHTGGTAFTHAPGAGTAAIVTLAAAGAGTANIIGKIDWSYSATPTAGSLKIEAGSGTTVWSVDVTSAGPGFIPWVHPYQGPANTPLIVTLGTAGAAVSGKVNVHAWTE